MAEFYNSWATGQANALARQKATTERNNLAELQSLAPKVISGDLDATDRAFALDPKTAQAYQGQQDRERQQLVGLARTLTNSASNPQYQAAVYNSAVPFLARRFGAENIPKVWDPVVGMPIAQQILDLDKNTPSLGGTGGTVQSQKIGDDGFIYNTFRDGRMVNTGIKADRQAWFRDQPGFEPTIVNKDGTMQTVGGAPAAAQPTAGGVRVSTVDGPVQMNIEGMTADQQQRLAQTVSMMRQSGYPEADIDGFVSAQVTSARNNAPPRQSLARPTAGQEAADAERARTAVRNENFGIDLEQDRLRKEQEARIEADKAKAVQEAKSQEERAATARAKSAALNNVKRGITRIDEALTAIERLRGVDSGPLDQYLVARTKEGQELAAAVGAIQDSMLALTRVPGVGSQSDLEARLANLKYPDLGNYPSVNRNNYSQLKAFASDLERQFGGSDTEAAPASGPQPGTVEDGYRFRGGNPSDPNNWERI